MSRRRFESQDISFEALRTMDVSGDASFEMGLLQMVFFRRFECFDNFLETMRVGGMSGIPIPLRSLADLREGEGERSMDLRRASSDLDLLPTVCWRSFESTDNSLEGLRKGALSGIPMPDKSLECTGMVQVSGSEGSLDLDLVLIVPLRRFERADNSLEGIRVVRGLLIPRQAMSFEAPREAGNSGNSKQRL